MVWLIKQSSFYCWNDLEPHPLAEEIRTAIILLLIGIKILYYDIRNCKSNTQYGPFHFQYFLNERPGLILKLFTLSITQLLLILFTLSITQLLLILFTLSITQLLLMWLPKQTAIISLYGANWPVFSVKAFYVYRARWSKSLK